MSEGSIPRFEHFGVHDAIAVQDRLFRLVFAIDPRSERQPLDTVETDPDSNDFGERIIGYRIPQGGRSLAVACKHNDISTIGSPDLSVTIERFTPEGNIRSLAPYIFSGGFIYERDLVSGRPLPEPYDAETAQSILENVVEILETA